MGEGAATPRRGGRVYEPPETDNPHLDRLAILLREWAGADSMVVLARKLHTSPATVGRRFKGDMLLEPSETQFIKDVIALGTKDEQLHDERWQQAEALRAQAGARAKELRAQARTHKPDQTLPGHPPAAPAGLEADAPAPVEPEADAPAPGGPADLNRWLPSRRQAAVAAVALLAVVGLVGVLVAVVPGTDQGPGSTPPTIAGGPPTRSAGAASPSESGSSSPSASPSASISDPARTAVDGPPPGPGSTGSPGATGTPGPGNAASGTGRSTTASPSPSATATFEPPQGPVPSAPGPAGMTITKVDPNPGSGPTAPFTIEGTCLEGHPQVDVTFDRYTLETAGPCLAGRYSITVTPDDQGRLTTVTSFGPTPTKGFVQVTPGSSHRITVRTVTGGFESSPAYYTV
ncbi:hypothetical protein ACGFX4_38770 [Kitasatospora sp. NPDC048365]|uniref:hypothetical protein n=1 Tax=Kitasatospora sp. NPDC048365 TaxID=3364050 RepID=UPI00371BC327